MAGDHWLGLNEGFWWLSLVDGFSPRKEYGVWLEVPEGFRLCLCSFWPDAEEGFSERSLGFGYWL